MNIYVLVEGTRVEPLVYAQWIPHINPSLSQVDSLISLRNNNFLIFGGGGYPGYLTRIKNAVADLNGNPTIDRLVVAVDSEQATRAARFQEIDRHISMHGPTKPYKIVIQHYCFESWCLGNKKIAPKPHCTGELRDLKNFFDVGLQDPELLPSKYPGQLTAAKFSAHYLKKCMQDRGASYSKRNPTYVANPTFLFQLQRRLNLSGHIGSLQTLVDAFI